MLFVFARHKPGCPHAPNASSKKCACPKYIDGTLPGRSGRFRISAKTKSREQAELLVRKYERSALAGEEVKIAKTLPTVKEAVAAYIGDARARGLAVATTQKLSHIFESQLLGFCAHRDITFLHDLNARNLTEWRSTWLDKALAKKKKFERVVGFFWFCSRMNWCLPDPRRSFVGHPDASLFLRISRREFSTATPVLGSHPQTLG